MIACMSIGKKRKRRKRDTKKKNISYLSKKRSII